MLMTGKTFLVTGGAGFIGSHLCDTLISEGHTVISVDNFNDFYNSSIKRKNIASILNNKRFKLFETDIRNKNELDRIFQEYSINVVIHIAAMAGVRPSIEQPLLYEEVNVKGTLNVLQCMQEHHVKNLVFASSSSVYGNSERVPFQENDCLDPVISPYAATKKASEEFCRVYHHLFHINMVLLRFFTVYGPRQRPDLAIHKFTRLIMEGKPIPFYGDGTTKRDYAYIDDIIHGVLASVNFIMEGKNIFEIFNLSGNRAVTLKEMVERIEAVSGKKANLNVLPMQPGDVVQTRADISKAEKMLGFHPDTSFEQGIAHFLKWYKENHMGKTIRK